MKRAIIVGVTGGFGTGKTTVARMFQGLGAVVISADKIAHSLILPGGAIYKKVVSLFGASILKKDNSINRKRLARIVFNDKAKLLLLNSLIHPEVIKKIKDTIKRNFPFKKIYIIDAPLLIEAGCLNMIDKLVVITTDHKTQIRRCLKKWSLDQIQRRIGSQLPLAKKRPLADFIIDNNGSLHSTRKMVEKIWREIKNGPRKD